MNKTTALDVTFSLAGYCQGGMGYLLSVLAEYLKNLEGKGWTVQVTAKDVPSNPPTCLDQEWELDASQTFYSWEELYDAVPVRPNDLHLAHGADGFFVNVIEREMELVVLHGYSTPADAHQYVAICPELLDYLWGDWGYQAVLGRFNYWSQMTVEDALQKGVWIQYHSTIGNEAE